MGSVPRNGNIDTRTLNLLEGVEVGPPPEEDLREFQTCFKSNSLDGYPVWTENKSKLIAQYVYEFIMVTKHGTYIDGFAGPQVEQYNDVSWSAKRVLEVQPPWIKRFVLCDMDPAQVDRLRQLQAERHEAGDKRAIDIYAGDFNSTVDEILGSGVITERVATFCVLDQRNLECKWSTVQKLALHKTIQKIELFYFVPVGWLPRVLAAARREEKLQQIREWWGRDDVDLLQQACGRRQDVATLFVQRFKEELGYKSVLPWAIHDRGAEGQVMFYMVHATDHPRAPGLMNRAYRKATNAASPMDHVQDDWIGHDASVLLTDPAKSSSGGVTPRPKKRSPKKG